MMDITKFIEQTLNQSNSLSCQYDEYLSEQIDTQIKFLEQILQLLKENKTLLNRFERFVKKSNYSANFNFFQESDEFNIRFIEKIVIKSLEQLKLDLETSEENLEWAIFCNKIELLLIVLVLVVDIIYPNLTTSLAIIGALLLAMLFTAVTSISLKSTVIEQSNLIYSLEENTSLLNKI